MAPTLTLSGLRPQQPPNWRFLFSEIARLQRPIGRTKIWSCDYVARPHFGYSIMRHASPNQLMRIRFIRP